MFENSELAYFVDQIKSKTQADKKKAYWNVVETSMWLNEECFWRTNVISDKFPNTF